MAKLGTVFVELSLDDKVYKQKLGEQLTSTTATAKGIEQSWKVLGQRSDDVFNAQRRSYENALTLIKNSHNATKQDIIRAEQAAADKIRRINEQQYGHQTTMIEGLKKNWLAATAAITAASVAMYKAYDMADQAAKYEQQKVALNNIAASYGANANQIIADLKRVSGGTIDAMTMVEKAGTAMMLGIAPDKISKLMEIARSTSKMTGQSVSEAFDNITLAVGRQSKMILDNLGIIVSAEDANKKYAETLNKTVEQLTDADKKMAFLNATVAAGEDLIKRLGTQTDTTRDKIDTMKAAAGDLKIMLGEGLLRVAYGVTSAFQWLAAGVLSVTAVFPKLLEFISRANAKIYEWTGQTDRMKASLAEAASLKKTYDDLLGASGELSNKSASNMSFAVSGGKQQPATARYIPNAAVETSEAIKEHTKAIHDNNKAAKEAEAAHKAAAEAIKRNYEQAINQMMDEINVGVDETMKSIDLIEQHNKMKLDEQMDGMSQADKAIADIKRLESEKLAITEQMHARGLLNEKEYEDRKTEIAEHAAKKVHAIHMDVLENGLGQMASAFREMSSIYEEGSQGAHMWAEAAKAFEIAQSAAAVASAVAAIATQGSGDPYTAFARVAAMAATMASFLATIGKSIGSGGSTSGSTNIYHSSSKTLGTNEASESAMRSYDLLKDTYQMQYTKLSAINSELRSLNANLTGLATSIAQTGGANQFLTGRPSNKFDFMMREMFAARGIYMPSTSVGDILSGGGVDASGYMKFGRKPEYSELNPLIDKYVDQSMVDMAKLFSTMGGAFGVSNDVIGQYNIPAISMNFKGLSDEEIQQRIIRQFSDIMDTGIEDIFGNAVYTFVKGFQQIDESIGETVTRLMRNREIVSEFMTSTGVALNKTTQEAISFSESLITIAGGLDALTDAFNSFYNNFYSDSEKQINYQRQLTDIVDDFGITTLPANREGWRNLVNSMAGVNDEAYVSFLNASDMAHEYYSYIEEANENALQAAEEARQERITQITTEFEFRKAALTDLYNRQLQEAQDRLSAITEIANKLTAARERMKVQDAIIEAANFRGAKSNLMRGIWNDDSLNTLTGINPGQYSSRQDYLRDYYDIYNQLSALEQDALSKKSAAERTIDWLKSQYEIDLQNLELQRQQAESLVVIKQVCTRTNKGLQEFDDGGIASGPSSGYEARLHGTELVISPRKGYSATVKSNNEDVVNSINELRAEIRGILVSMNNTAEKSHDIIDNWDRIGLPAEQT